MKKKVKENKNVQYKTPSALVKKTSEKHPNTGEPPEETQRREPSPEDRKTGNRCHMYRTQ